MDFDSGHFSEPSSLDPDTAFPASWLSPVPSSLSHQMNADYFTSPPMLPPGFGENAILSNHRTTTSIPLAISTAVPLAHLQQSPLVGSPQASNPIGLGFTPSLASHWPSMLARRNSFQPLVGGPLSGSSPLSAQILNSSNGTPVSGHVLSAPPLFPGPTLAPAAAISPPRSTSTSLPPRPIRQTPTPRKTLTDADRKRMCEFHEQHPTVKQTDIGAIFGVERSTVSKVLRLKDKYLRKSDDPLKSPIRSPIRKARSKPSDVERALATWSKNQEDKRGKSIEDEELRQRYIYFANLIGCIESTPKCDHPGWAEGFRQKNLLLSRAGTASMPASATLSPIPQGHTISPNTLPTSFSSLSDIQDIAMNELSPPHMSSIDARIHNPNSHIKSHDSRENLVNDDDEAALSPRSRPVNSASEPSSASGDVVIEKDVHDTSDLPVALRPESVRAGSQSPHFSTHPSSIAGSTRSNSKKQSPSATALPPLTTTGLNPPTTLTSVGGVASTSSQKHGVATSTPLTSSTTGSFRYFQSPMTPGSGENPGPMADISVYPLTPNGPAGLIGDTSGNGATSHALSYQSAAQSALFKSRRGTMGPPGPMGLVSVSTVNAAGTVPASHFMFGARRTGSFNMPSHTPSPLQSTPLTGGSGDSVPSIGEACAAMDILMRYLQNSQIGVEADEFHHVSRVAERLYSQGVSDSQFGPGNMMMSLNMAMTSGESAGLATMCTSSGSFQNQSLDLVAGKTSHSSMGHLGDSTPSASFEMDHMQMGGLSEDSLIAHSGLPTMGSIDQHLYMNSGASSDHGAHINSAAG